MRVPPVCILAFSLVSFFSYSIFRLSRKVAQQSPPTKLVHDYERFLFGALSSVDWRLGLGNNVFEICTLAGIARHLGRTPVISLATATYLKDKYTEMPHLLDGLRWDLDTIEAATAPYPHSCCAFVDPHIHVGPYAPQQSVRVKLDNIQSFKYFQNFARDQIRERLKVVMELEEFAKEKLVDPDFLSTGDHTICVHTYRGNVSTDVHVARSSKTFVVPAITMLEKRVRVNHRRDRPVFVLLGNDKEFMKDVVRDLPENFNTTIAFSSENMPAEVEWEFSRQYCDSVLLSASASTFGWWLAYNSKGFDVYYNTVSTKPGGKIGAFEHEDFFPAEWTPLEYDTSTEKVGVSPPRV